MSRTARQFPLAPAALRAATFAPPRGILSIAGILAAVVFVHWPTARELLGLGERSDGRLALAGAALLAVLWLRRHELPPPAIRIHWPGIFALAGLGALWLAGELVFARIVVDVAVIAMLPMAVLAVLGPRALSSVGFAWVFLLPAIPWDAPLIPVLAGWTSDFTFLALRLAGIPVVREGEFFALPTGSWLVGDGCSGVKYLGICLILGLFYAWLLFRSPAKRLAFVAGAAAIGIAGNWLRATLTIVIAHASDNRFLRDDHSDFGWLLYAIFLTGYGAIGYAFRDRNDGPASRPAPPPLAEIVHPRAAVVALALAGGLVALTIWPLAREASAPRAHAEGPIGVADIAARHGWSRADAPAVAWAPQLANPRATRIQSFTKNGRQVDVFIGLFRHESWQSRLVAVDNRLVDPEQQRWALASRGRASSEIAGRPLAVETATVVGGETRLAVWRWYWVDGMATASGPRAKLRQALAGLRGTEAASAWIAISTRADGMSDAAVAAMLDEFVREIGESIELAIWQSTGPSAPPTQIRAARTQGEQSW